MALKLFEDNFLRELRKVVRGPSNIDMMKSLAAMMELYPLSYLSLTPVSDDLTLVSALVQSLRNAPDERAKMDVFNNIDPSHHAVWQFLCYIAAQLYQLTIIVFRQATSSLWWISSCRPHSYQLTWQWLMQRNVDGRFEEVTDARKDLLNDATFQMYMAPLLVENSHFMMSHFVKMKDSVTRLIIHRPIASFFSKEVRAGGVEVPVFKEGALVEFLQSAPMLVDKPSLYFLEHMLNSIFTTFQNTNTIVAINKGMITTAVGDKAADRLPWLETHQDVVHNNETRKVDEPDFALYQSLLRTIGLDPEKYIHSGKAADATIPRLRPLVAPV